jgi:hypothetical protein
MSRGQVRPQIFILDFSKEKPVSSIKKLALPSADFGMRLPAGRQGLRIVEFKIPKTA